MLPENLTKGVTSCACWWVTMTDFGLVNFLIWKYDSYVAAFSSFMSVWTNTGWMATQLHRPRQEASEQDMAIGSHFLSVSGRAGTGHELVPSRYHGNNYRMRLSRKLIHYCN